MAAESGMDAINSAETKPKERDSVSRVRENRSHGLRRGRAASAGFRLAALFTLKPFWTLDLIFIGFSWIYFGSLVGFDLSLTPALFAGTTSVCLAKQQSRESRNILRNTLCCNYFCVINNCQFKACSTILMLKKSTPSFYPIKTRRSFI